MNYSLDEIRKCSLALVNEDGPKDAPQDLVDAAKKCWDFVCKRSDYKTSYNWFGVLWQAAYWDLLHGQAN